MRSGLKVCVAAAVVTAALLVTASPAAAVTNSCSVSFWTGKCSSAATPANHTLNRVWIVLDGGAGYWEVWDLDTGVRVGAGEKLSTSEKWTFGVYGLYGNRYQLRLRNYTWGYTALICDC